MIPCKEHHFSFSVSAVVFSPLVFHWFSMFCSFHLFVLDSTQLYCTVYLCFQAIVSHVVFFVFALVLYHILSFFVVFMCRKKRLSFSGLMRCLFATKHVMKCFHHVRMIEDAKCIKQ